MNRKDKEELLKILRAKQRAERDKELINFQPSIIQKMFLLAGNKIRILCGANRSGKSVVGAVDVLIRATGIIPKSIEDDYNKEFIRTGDYWVTSLDFPASRDITQKKVFFYCPKRIVNSFNREHKKLNVSTDALDSTSDIGFKSADSGRDKFQGTSMLGIWNDEETPEDIWDEEYMRTTDCSGFLTLTFTPIKGLTWAYNKLYQRAGKRVYTKNKSNIPEEVGYVHSIEEIEKLKDRELVVMTNTSEGADEDIVCFQMSIYDNIHLPAVEVQRAEKKYKFDPHQYHARILGGFTKLTGRNVFPTEPLLKGQAKAMSTFKRGDLINGQFKEHHKGKLTIFKGKKELGKGFYIIGGDVAEGLDIGDYSCAQVLDRLTCEQIAIWHGKCSPEEYASILVELGKYYNNAFIAPERNFHGFGVVNRIRDHFKYRRLYCETDPAQATVKQNVNSERKYGWETNVRTKPIMIQMLASFIHDNHIKINDFHTFEELITYVYDKEGRTGAMGGCYDDRVMALAIALQLFRNTPIVRYKSNNTPHQIKVSEITGY